MAIAPFITGGVKKAKTSMLPNISRSKRAPAMLMAVTGNPKYGRCASDIMRERTMVSRLRHHLESVIALFRNGLYLRGLSARWMVAVGRMLAWDIAFSIITDIGKMFRLIGHFAREMRVSVQSMDALSHHGPKGIVACITLGLGMACLCMQEKFLGKYGTRLNLEREGLPTKGTGKSRLTMVGFMSIASLWNNSLVDRCMTTKKFIIEMLTAATTKLKTWNFGLAHILRVAVFPIKFSGPFNCFARMIQTV